MGNTPRRIRKSVYRDKYGDRAVAIAAGQRREKRFPFGTSADTIDRWLRDTRHTLRASKPVVPRGTLQADAERYFRTVQDLASFVQRRSEIRAWVKAIELVLPRHANRSQIDQPHVREIRGHWLSQGVAPKTINNRVFALQHLYRTLDGKHCRTPCDDLKPLPVHKRPAVRIDDVIVRAIYQQLLEQERTGKLRDHKTRARFMVFASTGHRPSEIGRAQVGDVDLERRLWIPRDGKGGYCPGVYLNDDMLEAWTVFIDADAWGWFDNGSFAQVIRNAGLPAHLTPYQLRHTVGIAMSESGVDLKDIGDHLGHKRIETTRRHYVPVLGSRLQRASELLTGRKLWDAPPEAPLSGEIDSGDARDGSEATNTGRKRRRA